jgi:hypothetical protein
MSMESRSAPWHIFTLWEWGIVAFRDIFLLCENGVSKRSVNLSFLNFWNFITETKRYRDRIALFVVIRQTRVFKLPALASNWKTVLSLTVSFAKNWLYIGRWPLQTELQKLKGKLRDFFYMLAKYVPDDTKYIFTKFYRHISTNQEANRKFVISISTKGILYIANIGEYICIKEMKHFVHLK